MLSIRSIIENLIASGIERTLIDKWKEKRRIAQLQESIDKILNREKVHPCYNSLDRVLSHTNSIQDFISSICQNRSFSFEERIEEL